MTGVRRDKGRHEQRRGRERDDEHGPSQAAGRRPAPSGAAGRRVGVLAKTV
jgi:hypothetical protein